MTTLLVGRNAVGFADASFDGVFCSNVLQHTDDPAGILSEIAFEVFTWNWVLVVERVSDT